MHRAFILVLTATLCPVAFADEPVTAHHIEIIADVPSIAVAPRRPGPITMRLPSLTYLLTLTADCDENWQPDSVSINVADSRTSLTADELRRGESLQFELRVPSNQISPLRLEKFCVTNGQTDTASPNRITIPSVLSAQASLRCATESAETIRYVTVPLDISLECLDSPPANE